VFVTGREDLRLPVDGDDLLLNMAAEGSKEAREEGRLHAVSLSNPAATQCNWPFKKSSNALTTKSCDSGVLCAKCFGLERHKAPKQGERESDVSRSDME
jgi:hypothetical protein